MADDRVPLQEDTSPSTVSPTPIAPKTEGGDLNFMDDIEYHRASDLLEVSYDERKDLRNAEKLAYLIDWAKDQTKSDNRIELIERIRTLQRTLGMSERGLAAIKKLYQWARLDQRRLAIEREQNLIAG